MEHADAIAAHLISVTGARSALRIARLQTLWSGWGEIARYALEDGPVPSVIVKRVEPPPTSAGRSMARKRRSYIIERAFYERHAAHASARIPAVLHLSPGLFVLEDLDAAGFSGRAVGAGSIDEATLTQCLDWLAHFHASFLGRAPAGLWPVGTYWHLETRPDELKAMAPGRLKSAAAAIDARLSAATHQTLVHGDAKVANFCLGATAVAAVDFQYVGGGCGMKDVAYFLGSCLDDRALTVHAPRLLDRYFDTLRGLLGENADAVEAEWRMLLPLAWADFERFLAGWAPGHWKRSGYAAQQTEEALLML